MFCSKCGKTIRRDDTICPSCQAPIGDNRFGGIPYTSAQFTIAPGQTDFSARQASSDPANDYTRTSYTSMDGAQEGGEVDTRTTYRPVYEGGSMPESVRKDVRTAMAGEETAEEEEAPVAEEIPAAAPISPESYSESAKVTLSTLDEELQPEEAIDMSQFRSRPIQSTGRAGISRDVSEYIRKLEDDQSRRASRPSRSSRRAAAAPVYDDYQEHTDDNPGGYSEYADNQGYDDGYDDGYNPDYDQEGVFDEIDDADFDDMRRGRFSIGSIIKILLALIIVAAIVFGAVKWIGYITGKQSSAPIDGVSEELYEQGIALIKSHTGQEYVNGLISTYTGEGGFIALNSQLETDKGAIDALLPAEPAANDAIFISALQAIQDNIGGAAVMDALAVGKNDASAIEKSEANWQIVNNSIVQLEACKTAEELTSVINGQMVTVQTETPQPTQAPVESFTPLQKGDKNDKVLELQERLYKLGYLNDDRDGAFGNNTQTAVKAFQEKAGLEATGIADAATQQLLFSDQAPNVNGQTEAGIAAAAATPQPQAEVIQPAEVVETAAGSAEEAAAQ